MLLLCFTLISHLEFKVLEIELGVHKEVSIRGMVLWVVLIARSQKWGKLTKSKIKIEQEKNPRATDAVVLCFDSLLMFEAW